MWFLSLFFYKCNSFSLWLLSGFFFSCALKIIALGIVLWDIYPDWCFLSFLYLCFNISYKYKEILNHCFKQFVYSFSSFFSFEYSHYMYVPTYVIISKCWYILFNYFQSYFSLLFWFWFLLTYPQVHRFFFLSCVQSPNRSIKSILHFCNSVFFFFIRISISLILK